jgi:hypothetical protein
MLRRELKAEFPNAETNWHALSRLVVFCLASSSIVCLLMDFYGICPMRIFAPFIFLPAFLALCVMAVWDRDRGEGFVWRAVWIGLVGGLISAVSYDVFRLPFVFAREWGIDAVVTPMPLFKVFPRFGAMILGEPIEQPSYSMAAQVWGWLYHFSNGATFGVMYLALVGDARRRHWTWAIVFAVALELGMLLTPYPRMFGIAVTARFVVVTLAAHAIFGTGLGLSVRWLAQREPRPAALARG